MLLDKMMDIERKQSEYNPGTIYKKSFHPSKNLHIGKRMNELRRINTENKVKINETSIHLFYFFQKIGNMSEIIQKAKYLASLRLKICQTNTFFYYMH